jgi:hypothetical protein
MAGPAVTALYQIRWMTMTILALALLVGVWTTYGFFARVLSRNVNDCNDGNVCTLDEAVGVGDSATCSYRPRVNSASCKSACYVAGTRTHCDGHGSCIANDYTTCKGYCDAAGDDIRSGDCDPALFPIRPYWGPLSSDLDDRADFNNSGNDCFASQCVRIAVMVTFESEGPPIDGDWEAYGMAHANCSDLLDVQSTTVDTSCIVSTSIDLDSMLLTSYLQWSNDELDSGDNYTARACIFRYACGQFNVSAFYDPVSLDTRRRSALADRPPVFAPAALRAHPLALASHVHAKTHARLARLTGPLSEDMQRLREHGRLVL